MPLQGTPRVAASRRPYIETFEGGACGWVSNRHDPLLVRDGVAYCYSSWWVDGNHAPPGAGYLQLIMYLITDLSAFPANGPARKAGSNNRFVAEGYSRNFANTRLTVRLRGEIDAQGAELLVLVQGKPGRKPASCASHAHVLHAQPISVTPDWSDQTLTLVPDPCQWTCLGARHDLGHVYGRGDIAELLTDVDIDLIFVLFPIHVVPLHADPAKRDRLWAGRDYTPDPTFLPRGLLMFDTVTIDYPG